MNMDFFWSGIYHGLLILAALLLTIRAIVANDVKEVKSKDKAHRYKEV